MKTRKEKEKMLNELKDIAQRASMIALFDFKGMTVMEMNDLRKRMKEKGYGVKVVKNNLLRISLEKQAPEIKDVLVGNTAIIFSFSDEVEPLKIFVEFVDEVNKGELKGGVLHGKFISKDELKKLSNLPPVQELRAKVVGGISAPLYGLVWSLGGILRGLVYALNALKEKKEKEV
jgi:large subunit ribosomal protein L10